VKWGVVIVSVAYSTTTAESREGGDASGLTAQASRAGYPGAARAAGLATKTNDPTLPNWRVLRAGGRPTKLSGDPYWTPFFERKWAEDGQLEIVGGKRRGKRRGKPSRHVR
jgi:hypothetical protein